MIPLWIRASLPSEPPRCGCALLSVGPPWVAQRVCPMPVLDGGQRVGDERLTQVAELAGALLRGHVVAVHQGHAGGVVAAVLEPGEALHDHVESLAVDVRADVAHDAAHGGEPNGATGHRPESRRTPE